MKQLRPVVFKIAVLSQITLNTLLSQGAHANFALGPKTALTMKLKLVKRCSDFLQRMPRSEGSSQTEVTYRIVARQGESSARLASSALVNGREVAFDLDKINPLLKSVEGTHPIRTPGTTDEPGYTKVNFAIGQHGEINMTVVSVIDLSATLKSIQDVPGSEEMLKTIQETLAEQGTVLDRDGFARSTSTTRLSITEGTWDDFLAGKRVVLESSPDDALKEAQESQETARRVMNRAMAAMKLRIQAAGIPNDVFDIGIGTGTTVERADPVRFVSEGEMIQSNERIQSGQLELVAILPEIFVRDAISGRLNQPHMTTDQAVPANRPQGSGTSGDSGLN